MQVAKKLSRDSLYTLVKFPLIVEKYDLQIKFPLNTFSVDAIWFLFPPFIRNQYFGQSDGMYAFYDESAHYLTRYAILMLTYFA